MDRHGGIVYELHRASNSIFDIDTTERQRLLLAGIEETDATRRMLTILGRSVPAASSYMEDMEKVAEMAARGDAVEVLVAAGMSMLATEIEGLRRLLDEQP